MQNIPKWLVQTISGLLAVLLLVLTVNQLYTVKNKSSEVNGQHTITITAEGKVPSVPDLVTVSAGVQNEGDTAPKAQSVNSTKINKAIEFLKKQYGIKDEDIRTQDYSIYPKYDYIGGKSIVNGYTANQTLVVKIHDIAKVGDVLSGLTENDINQIQNVAYSFDNPDNLKEQAREMALTNAKEKAENLAKAAGVKLGKLVSFSESTNTPGGPVPYAMAQNSGMGGGGSPQLQPGSQDVVANVSVTYEIK
jgi:uncharacterized protein YggE